MLAKCGRCGAVYAGGAGSRCPSCAPRPKSEHVRAPKPGDIVGGHRLLEKVGRGGLGLVFRAERDGRVVALKVVSPLWTSDPSFSDRFARETEALGTLRHPNIVRLEAAGRDGELFYLAMELVKGGTLRDLGTVEPGRAAAILAEVCDALEFAHAAGFVHRDIKPENILLHDDGRPRVADFGLARMIGDAAALTTSGAFLGTAPYMAPEQIGDPRKADARADVYSAGAVFRELLTGHPRRGAPPAEPEAARIVARAMAGNPAARYRSAAEFRAELLAFNKTRR